MAPVYMTTSFGNIKIKSNLFNVTIEDFDNETHDYMVTAETADDAAHEAVNLAAMDGIYEVYNMFISMC